MIRFKQVRAASFLLIAATFPAVAAHAATEEGAPAAETEKQQATPEVPGASTPLVTLAPEPIKAKAPWRGSSITYGHAASTVSLDRGALPFYNPTYGHRLELAPEWHFNDLLFARARLEIGQELTLADDTEYLREVVFSDVTAQLGTTGWTESFSGIKVSGDLQFTVPTAKTSWAQSKVFAIGPRVSLSRTFAVRDGLTVSYGARYTRRFHRYTTIQTESARLPNCGDIESIECAEFLHTGRRNVMQDVLHGASVSFQPSQKLSLSTSLQWSHGFLYALSPSPIPTRDNEYADAGVTRNASLFSIGAGYQILPALSLGGGVTTISPPGEDGSVRNPFFNQFTTLYLDLGVDFEALLSRS